MNVDDRVRVTDSCRWEDRRGKLGTVTYVSEEFDTVHVKLDDEDVAFADGATASFELSSVERVYVTKTGAVLVDADIEALADEAERGYDVSQLEPKR